MLQPYVDVSRWALTGLGVSPKLANRATGEIATDRNGRPKYLIDVYARDTTTGDSDLLKVNIASSQPPEVMPGQPVSFEGLRAVFWQNGDRAGLSYNADAVRSGEQSQRPVKAVAS
jgi:hypothetical protein